MATEQHILQDSTDSVVGYPPFRGLGKITALNHKLRTPSTDFQSAFEAATYDTVDTTLSAGSAEGATTVTVSSATGITAGRTYVIGLGATATRQLHVEVESVSGTTVTLADPLPCAVASSDLFYGWRCSHALLATETDQEGEGLVKWQATIGGVTVEWDQQFRIVHSEVAYTLNAARLVSLFPMAHDLQPSQDPRFNETIAAAWDAYLVPSLESAGMKPQRIHSWSRLEPWHATACVYHLLLNNRRTSPEALAMWEEKLTRARDGALASPDFWYDPMGEDDTRDDEATVGTYGAYRMVIG